VFSIENQKVVLYLMPTSFRIAGDYDRDLQRNPMQH